MRPGAGGWILPKSGKPTREEQARRRAEARAKEQAETSRRCQRLINERGARILLGRADGQPGSRPLTGAHLLALFPGPTGAAPESAATAPEPVAPVAEPVLFAAATPPARRRRRRPAGLRRGPGRRWYLGPTSARMGSR